LEEQERLKIAAKNHIIQISEESKNANLRNEHANLKLQSKSEIEELVNIRILIDIE
jgi:hypothetical protein